ncbi:MAG: hypothetical protein ACD_77C00226G0001 [uncultured bacterium]|nr:MAG: hypothetical protein ACD_77C00226G0001 [uncultured bacterium]HBY02572.1 hypothetical protein [Rikenellaceae bacterium]
MVTKENFDNLRVELSVKSKNGLDFTLSASIIWLLIAFIWTLNGSSYDKSILTFIVGSLMLPLALLLSKVLKTVWTNKDNPLQPLGLWLNFAQLLYFPFLIFTLMKMPDYFAMVYVIITGAHFFPYAWFYKTSLYAIFAGIISFGALALGLLLPVEKTYLVPVFMSASLVILTVFLYLDSKKKHLVTLIIKHH